MFNRAISGLTLTKTVADGLFQNINGRKEIFGDETFLATLRALMYKRVPKEESITFDFTSSNYDGNVLRNANPRDCVSAFLEDSSIRYGGHGCFHIHSFNSNGDGVDESFNIIDKRDGVAALFGKGIFQELPDVGKFLEQCGKFRARVFISESRKCTLIFVEKLDVKKLHLLQSLIPRYMPWYMKDMPFDEEEFALIRTLTKRYAPDYVDAIENIAKRFDFRTQTIRNYLRGFETSFEKEKLANVRDELRRERNYIDELESRFRDTYVKIDELTTTELGLIAKINNSKDSDEDTELIEYFLCNKNIDLVRVDRGMIEFIVRTTISNYDPDVVEGAMEKIGESFFYRHYATKKRYNNEEMTDERIYRLVKALFIDEIFKLRVCAAYRLNFSTGGFEGRQEYHFPEDVLATHTPNQHIQHYGCLGNNRPIISKAMLNRDYVGAVIACVASAFNANFTEANTGTFFMEHICDNNVGKIIQMPDGTTATPLDAVKWLEEQDEKKEKEEENE